MIGFKATVEIYGMSTDKGVYLAEVKSNLPGATVAFALFRKEPQKIVNNVTVIALAYGNDNKVKRIIVAPERDAIMYEPEIRDRLSSVKGFTYTRLLCLYEKSCGAVVFNRLHKVPKVLLVKNKNGRYWSFPKGHVEYGETELETATREIKEETGLTVNSIDGFREVRTYSPFGRIRKRVVFFLAEAYTDRVIIQEEEIDSSVWVSFKEAKNMCCYDTDKKVLAKAEQLVRYM